jgi:hypothetical protein
MNLFDEFIVTMTCVSPLCQPIAPVIDRGDTAPRLEVKCRSKSNHQSMSAVFSFTTFVIVPFCVLPDWCRVEGCPSVTSQI